MSIDLKVIRNYVNSIASSLFGADRNEFVTLIHGWEVYRQEREHQEKRMDNATGSAASNHGTDMRISVEKLCINPGEPFPTDSNETKLTIMGEQHRYMMCRIESLRNLLIQLNTDICKVSPAAGIPVRTMIRSLEEASRSFMTDARSAIKELSDEIQAEVDNQRIEKYYPDPTAQETSPGLEPVETGPGFRTGPGFKVVCKACGEEWYQGHQCPPTTIAR